jgi:hypothetical protein
MEINTLHVYFFDMQKGYIDSYVHCRKTCVRSLETSRKTSFAVHITLVIQITGSILAVKLNCMDIFLLYIVIDHDIVFCYLIHVERR